MFVIAALAALAVAAVVLWAWLNFANRDARDGGAGRVIAAFLGVGFATVAGWLIIVFQGVAENRASPTVSNDLGLLLVLAAAEAAWILLTCGLRRRALGPFVGAFLGLSVLGFSLTS